MKEDSSIPSKFMPLILIVILMLALKVLLLLIKKYLQDQVRWMPHPLRPAQAPAADPSLVQIFTQKQNLMQRPQCQVTSTDKYDMLPEHHFDGLYPSTASKHWASFEKYITFQTWHGSINTSENSKKQKIFALILTDIAWNSFEPVINDKPDIVNLKEKFMKAFNS